MRRGLFIAIEGSDGSGKGTQFELLVKKLRSEGYEVADYDFPQYEAESSYYVKRYLNGQYGTAEELGPYTPSLFYALDRYDASVRMKADLNAGKIVVSNRYVGSNMAHQATKFSTDEERKIFFQWLEQLEYNMLGIPRPDINLVLLVPAETAQELIDSRYKSSVDGRKRDIHELEFAHLKTAVHCYELLSNTYDEFVPIDCTSRGKLQSIEAIQDRIWRQLKSRINHIKKSETPAEPVKVDTEPASNPYIRRNENGSYSITSAGRQWLEAAVTNVNDSIYLTKNKLESITAAAAMARLSRRGDDMRVTVLDEFAQHIDNDVNDRGDEALLRRVITAYGDDSVQQLVGQHIVIEGASNLLTKKLQWGRLAAYLEQSTRYIFYDQKDADGNFKYFIPAHLPEGIKARYQVDLDTLFKNYSLVVRKLTEYVRNSSNTPEDQRDGAWKAATRAQACDAARGLLPVATKSTVGVYASGQAIESLVMHLQSDTLPEARETGDKILTEARKVIPTFLERADKPDRGGAWVAHRAQTRASVQKLVEDSKLTPLKGNAATPVKLTSYWPRNEMDLLPHMLFEHSTMSLAQLEQETAEWPYDDKLSAFRTYIGERLNRRHKPGRAFEMAHYGLELICDYGIFRDLQRHRMVDAMEWQSLTPHYGYEVPQLVSDAGLDEIYEECFDLSMQLYHQLFDAGYAVEAQYATLLGHKMRSKFMMNAREAYHFIELRTSPQGHPGYRKLSQQIFEAIKEVHPIIAEGMIFVNKDEDPELTRLAAERATQFKLEQLEESK